MATGILAILSSLAYLAWAILLVEHRQAGLALILLCAPMLLFGGGLFPPVLGLLIGAAAARLHAPPDWWRARFPAGLRRFTGALFPWFFGACILAWLAMFLGIGVLSCCFGFHSDTLIWALLVCMFGLLFLSAVSGIARDSLQPAGEETAR